MTFNVPNDCQNTMNEGFELNGTFHLVPGTCLASGGQATGTVAPSGPATSFCCMTPRP